MDRNSLLTGVILILLTACGNADGVPVDASDDVHCWVVASYYSGLAAHRNAPQDQRLAARAIAEWYSARLQDVVTESRDLESVKREAEPLLAAVREDPLGHRDKAMECMARATADPRFNRSSPQR